MDMSGAALPPRSGRYSKADEAHPLFPLYRQYLNSRARLMIDADDFDGWLYQHNAEQVSTRWSQHPRFAEFQAWCREVKSGRRPCCPTKDNPRGISFPDNFQFWLEGGRW